MGMDWVWPLMTLAGVGVVAWLVSREISQSTRGEVERRFVCPVEESPVVARFVSDFFDPASYSDVLRCSRFGDRPVTCGKQCLDLGKQAIARQHAAREAAAPAR